MFWHRGPASKYLEDTDQIYSDYEEREGGGWNVKRCMQQPGGRRRSAADVRVSARICALK